MSVANDPSNHDSSGIPTHLVDNAELLFGGTYSRDGFDLVITGEDGETLVIADYFSFNPPPSLALENGASMTPQMVQSLLPNQFEGALYAATAGISGGAAPERIGTASFLKGQVFRTGADGVERALKKGDAIFKGDIIEVKGSGFVLAKMVDGTRFRLGSSAKATLTGFEYDPSAEKGSFEATVTKGAFSYKSGRISNFAKGGAHSKISTPSAIIGIRGSELDGNVLADGSTTVIHTSGSLVVTDQNGGNPVTLSVPGNTSVILIGGTATFTPQATADQQQVVQEGMPPASQAEQDDKAQSDQKQKDEKQAEDDKAADGNDDADGDADASTDPEAGADGDAAQDGDGDADADGDGDDADDDGDDADDGDDDTDSDDTDSDSDDSNDSDSTDSGDADSRDGGNSDSTDGGDSDSSDGGDSDSSDGGDSDSSDGGDSDSSDGGDSDSSDGGDSDSSDGGDSSSSDSGDSSSADGGDSSSTDGGDSSSTEGGDSSSTDGGDSSSSGSSDSSTSDGGDSSSTDGGDSSSSSSTGDSGSTSSSSDTPTSTTTSSSDTSTSASSSSTTDSGTTDSGTSDPTPPPPEPQLPPDNPPVATNDTLNITDTNSIEIGATILSNDSDPDVGQTPSITSITPNSISGTLAFDVASQSVNYTPNPDVLKALGQGETATESFSYTIQSGDLTASAQSTIILTGTNDLPIAEDDAYTIDEDSVLSVAKEVGFLANDSDPDANDTLSLSAATVLSEDGATIALVGDGSFSFTPTGSDILNALDDGETFTSSFSYEISDSQGDKATAIVSVKVTGVNDAPVTESDTASTSEGETIVISPLDNDSDPESHQLTITEISEPTVGTAVLSADGQTIEYTASNTLDETGSQETITYTVSDGTLSSTETIVVTATGVNDAPTLNPSPEPPAQIDASVEGVIDITASVLATISDDSPNLAIVEVSPLASTLGIVTLGSVKYDPNGAFDFLNAGETATDFFSFKAADGDNEISSTYGVVINGVADAPTVDAPIVIDLVTSDTTVNVNLLEGANDIDASDQGNLVIQGVSFFIDGELQNVPDSSANSISDFLVDPASFGLLGGETTQILLTYNVVDTTGLTVSQSATITITSVNDAPTVSAPLSTAITQNDTSVPFDLLDNAVDLNGDVLSVTNVIISPNTSGIIVSGTQVSISPDFYKPLADGVSDVVTLSYQIEDGNGGSVNQTATITITGLNDLPVAVDDNFVANAGDLVSGNVLGNDTDIDNDPLSVIVASGTTTALGSYSILADGNFDYTAPAGFNGNDSFSYTTEDGNGGTAVGNVNFDVTFVDLNDPPTISVPSAPFTISEEGFVTVATTIADPDGTVALVSISTVGGVIFFGESIPGSLTLGGSGIGTSDLTLSGPITDLNTVLLTFDYSSIPDFNGAGSVTIDVNDLGNTGSDGAKTATLTVPVTVTPVNDVPFIVSPEPDVFSSDDTVDTIIDASLIFDDPDILSNGDVLTITVLPITDPLFTSISVGGSTTGFINNLITLDFAPGTGTTTLVITATDSAGATTTDTVAVTLSPSLQPTANPDAYVTTEDTPFATIQGSNDLLVNDTQGNGGVLSLDTSIVTPPANGTLSLVNSNGTFTYTPNPDFNGADSFQYRVIETTGTGSTTTTLTSIATASFTVTAVNDAPIVTVDNYNVTQDVAFTATLGVDDLLLNDSDPDGDTLVVNISPITPPANGSVTLNTNGTFTYTPDSLFTGTDSFVYVVSDGNGGTTTSTANINVLPPVPNSSIADGLYSNGANFSFGTTPVAADNVEIASGTTITTAGDVIDFNSFTVDGTFNVVGGSYVGTGNFQVNAGGVLAHQDSASISGPVTIASGGLFKVVGANIGQVLSFNANFFNSGTLELTGGSAAGGDQGAAIDGTSGNLVNFSGATILSSGVDDSRTITGDINNQGLIDVQKSLSITGTTLSSDTGNITVAAGQTLSINTTTTTIGMTTLSGAGAIEFLGTQSLSLSSNVSIDGAIPALSFPGNIAINGVGTLLVQSGESLTLTGDAVNTDLTLNAGSLFVAQGTSSIASTTLIQDGQITILGTLSDGDATLSVNNNFSNVGSIDLDSTSTVTQNVSIDSIGILTNSGTITTTNTSGMAGGTRNITGELNNTGALNLSEDTTISGTGDFTNDLGSISIAAGKTLDITKGNTTFGSGTTLVGNGTINLLGTQTLTLSSNYNIDDVSNPDITFGGLAGVITVNGPGVLSIASGTQVFLDADTIDADLVVPAGATLETRDSSSTISSTNFTLGGDLVVISTATGQAMLTVNNNFTNAGILRIDNEANLSQDAFFSAGGLVTNSGQIVFDNFGGNVGGQRRFTGDLDNQSTIDVNHNTLITGSTNFTTTTGSINVASGSILTIDSATSTIGTTTILTGAGEIDFIGNQNLTLNSAFTIDHNTQPKITLGTFSSTITIGGAGTLTIAAGSDLTLESDVINTPLVISAGAELKIIDTLSTVLTATTQNGQILVSSTDQGDATLNIGTGFTNNGLIDITNEGAGTHTTLLNQTSGTLLNLGTISFNDLGGGGTRTLSGLIDNQGFLDVNHNSAISTAGSFLTAGGLIDVDTGVVLTITAANTTVNSGTTFVGLGEIDLLGAQTLTVTTDFVQTGANAKLTFGGTIDVIGAGKFIIDIGGNLVLSADTISTNLDINAGGELEIREGASNIDSTLFNNTGELFINSTAGGDADLIHLNSFTNNGLITFDSEDVAIARSSTLTVTGGSLINSIGSDINFLNTGGFAGAFHILFAALDNQGKITVSVDSTIDKATAAHINSGSILTNTGVTFEAIGSTFTNQSAGKIEGGGTLDVSGLTFTNDGILVPGGSTIVDTLTVTGNVGQGASAVLLTDIASTGSFDILNVSGDYAIAGALDLNFLPGHNITGIGEVLTVVTAGSITGGSFAVSHNLGGAFNVTATQNANNVDVTINATFDVTFDNTSGDFLWESTTNWDGDLLPNVGENALISGFNVTHSAANTDTIASLTLQGGSTFILNNGQVNLTAPSTFFGGTTFVLDNGGLDAAAGLEIAGTFDFQRGGLTGSEVIVSGTLLAGATGPKNLNTTLKISGVGTIDQGAAIAGSGLLQVQPSGTLTIDASAVNVDFNNFGNTDVYGTSSFSGTNISQDGNFNIISDGAAAAVVTISAAAGLTNTGTLTLDSDAAATNATLTVSGTSLVNAPSGIILSTSTGAFGGNQRIINAAVDNQGSINVDFDLTINQTGDFINLGNIDIKSTLNIVTSATFNNNAGNINIDAGSFLVVDATGGSLIDGNKLSGTGTITLLGTQNLTINSSFNLSSNTPSLDLSLGTINIIGSGGASITLANDGQLNLSGDTIGATVDISNFGAILAQGTSVLGSSVFSQDGTLTVLTDVSGVANLTITNGFTNTGAITLDSTTDTNTTTLTINGPFINGATGSIFSVTSTSSLNTVREINTQFSNQGLVTVADALTINDSATFDNSGSIVIESEGSLTITAITAGNNSGSITLDGVSGVTAATTILDVSGVTGGLNNSGSIAGIGTVVGTVNGNSPTVGSSPGLVTITEDFNAGETSVLDAELEGEEAGISYDQLAVLGTATLNGVLNTSLLKNYQPISNTSYAILTAGLLLGSFDEANGLDISDSEVLDLNYGNNEVTLTLIDTTTVGTSADDTITSIGNQSVIVTGDGNDTITSIGTSDIVYAQAGNDTITVNADFKRVDGGEGIDTLIVNGDIDVVQMQGTQIDRIEVLSLDDIDSDTITLDSDGIKKLVDGSNDLTGIDDSLVVIGNDGDIVNLSGDFVLSGETTLDAGRGDENFRTFSDGESTLFVSDQFSLELTDSSGDMYVFDSGSSEGILSNASLEVAEESGELPAVIESIDFSGIESLPSLAPQTSLNLDFNMADVLDTHGTEDLSTVLSGLSELAQSDTNTDVSPILANAQDQGSESAPAYFNDSSSIDAIIYNTLTSGESFL